MPSHYQEKPYAGRPSDKQLDEIAAAEITHPSEARLVTDVPAGMIQTGDIRPLRAFYESLPGNPGGYSEILDKDHDTWALLQREDVHGVELLLPGELPETNRIKRALGAVSGMLGKN